MLKRLDVIVREESQITWDSLKIILDNIFDKMYSSTKNFGYAFIFDTRTKQQYYYYSDYIKNTYGLKHQKYILADGEIVTKNNLIQILSEQISKIKELILSNVKIKTEKLISKNGEVTLSEKSYGLTNNVLIHTEEGYEIYDAEVKEFKKIDNLPADKNYEVIVSYLTH